MMCKISRNHLENFHTSS